MTNLADALERITAGYYRVTESPALNAQREAWRRSRPLANLRVLDATPVFRNTVVKYQSLIAAGAELTVSAGALTPCDPAICTALRKAGLPVWTEGVPEGASFDLILDCAGCHAHVPSRYGYVELTRSGIHRYRARALEAPVFAADSGRIKMIETALGTGESFLRAMQQLGHDDWPGRRAAVFGYGKVGHGIVFYLRRAGAAVTVIDRAAALHRLPEGVTGIDLADRAAIDAALADAYAAVSATGVRHAHAGRFDLAKLAASDCLIANMGVEDEFGPEMPETRVLNRKRPLNFILDEPTRMSYIETTMALHNMGALVLLGRHGEPGLIEPARELEDDLLNISCTQGEAGPEIRAMLAEFKDMQTCC